MTGPLTLRDGVPRELTNRKTGLLRLASFCNHTFRCVIATNLEVPVEPSDAGGLGVGVVVLERVVINHVDDGTDDRGHVAGYPVQQWFQPTWVVQIHRYQN